MNVVLLVVDSLRARSLARAGGPRTPFLDGLARGTMQFRRAYASECWTLPSHMSMFTGLLPSAHGAHFQSMAYAGSAPTIAELLARAGWRTEVITRNSLFDGTIPGATRGFARNTRVLTDLTGIATPYAFVLALARPRVRRLIERSGFFGSLQKRNREFLTTLARMGLPADRRALDVALERMATHRRRGERYFLFLNLYDVHAPYSPSAASPLRSLASPRGWLENASLPLFLPRVSSHAYLRPGFRMSAYGRRMLRGRYHSAIELMDSKLAEFYRSAERAGLLDDTLLVLTSDHGEAFGDHDLYFHDASVYDTHLHVPLWIRHPDVAPGSCGDVVATRQLFDLFRGVTLGDGIRGTLLDPGARPAGGVALAEHFHYPLTVGLLERYTQNLAAAVVGSQKMIVRREGLRRYDLARDPDERHPEPATVRDFAAACRREGAGTAAIAAAVAHLGRWEATSAAA